MFGKKELVDFSEARKNCIGGGHSEPRHGLVASDSSLVRNLWSFSSALKALWACFGGEGLPLGDGHRGSVSGCPFRTKVSFGRRTVPLPPVGRYTRYRRKPSGAAAPPASPSGASGSVFASPGLAAPLSVTVNEPPASPSVWNGFSEPAFGAIS